MVTGALVGGAAESVTGFGSLSPGFTRDRPTLVLLKCIKIVGCSGSVNSCVVNGFHVLICNIVALNDAYVLAP